MGSERVVSCFSSEERCVGKFTLKIFEKLATPSLPEDFGGLIIIIIIIINTKHSTSYTFLAFLGYPSLNELSSVQWQKQTNK